MIFCQLPTYLPTLEFLIAVGLRLLIFEDFSTPYAAIRDPTLIKICKIKPHPTLIRNMKYYVNQGILADVGNNT